MELYAIFRRNAWCPDEVEEADARSSAELTKRSEEVRKIRSYVLAESGERMGAICLYQATNPDAIRAHARAADIPVDDVVKIDAIDVWRPDPKLAAPSPA